MRMAKTRDPERPFYLRARRQAAGLSQEKLALEIGTTKGVISQIETGHLPYNEQWINRICAALGLAAVDLFTSPDALKDTHLERIRAAWPAIPERHREALATLAETFSEAEGVKKTGS